MPRAKHPKKADEEAIETSKKMNDTVRVLAAQNPGKKVRLLFQDETGFGRINKPKN